MDSSLHQKNFVKFLDRNYCIAAHLTERLDELRESLLFSPIKDTLLAAISQLEAYTQKAEEIYAALNTAAACTGDLPLIAFLEHLFSSLSTRDNGTQYLCLLDYVSAANALMAESAKLAQRSLSAAGLDLPSRPLYDATLLEPLTTALAEAGQVYW
jgi:hypothetical protein